MTHLKKGDQAPNFSGVDQENKTISLNDFKGKKVALYFYPKDSTPGCTVQACNLRDNYSSLLNEGIQVIGVSADTVTSHKNFASKQELPFPLIADTEKSIITAYGIWGPKKFMGRTYDGIHRTTFLISEDQKILGIIDKPKTKDHAAEILEILK